MSVVTEIMDQVASRQRGGERRKMTALERREAIVGLLFISPWLIGFLVFYLTPMIASLVFSVTNFQLATPDATTFIGLANWRRALFEDPNTWTSLGITFRFALISLPIGMTTAFMLAVLLNSKHLIFPSLFRTLFYAPTMVPLVAAVVIWQQVLNPSSGWVNRLIEFTTGLPVASPSGLQWLNDPKLIYLAYTFIGLWGIGNAMLINLAALQGVPDDLYEAAEIDGAGWWQKLLNISIPMVSPIIFYNLILSMVGLLQYFIVPWVINDGNGAPEGTTRFYMVFFYKQAFSFANMGYGATLAWILFIVALLITLVLFGTSRYWVYYASERA